MQRHDFNPVKNTQRLILFTARVDLALAESTRAAGSLTSIRTTAKASTKISHSFAHRASEGVVVKVFWDSLLEWILLFHLTENLIEMRFRH